MKLDEKYKKMGFTHQLNRNDRVIHIQNYSSVEDLPPDPLQKRTVLPKKRAKCVRLKSFM